MEETAAEYGGGLEVWDESGDRFSKKSCKCLKRNGINFHLSTQDENPSPRLSPNVHFAA
jgi:hypothetical protein